METLPSVTNGVDKYTVDPLWWMHTVRRPAVSPTVSVGAEGRELTYRWTKGLCPQSSFSQSQLYPRSNDNLTPKQQIPFLSSEGT